MNNPQESASTIDLEASILDILSVIDQDREREIITRRFGIYDRRETLEQIGELLGITRERVRQLEKSILGKLKQAIVDNKITLVPALEKQFIRHLAELNRIARVQDLADHLLQKPTTHIERSRVAFVAELSNHLVVINENDHFHQSVAIREYGDEKAFAKQISEIVDIIKKSGSPLTIEQLHNQLSYEHPNHVRALANVSKHLASLKDSWGLVKWPTVNPKNIRDKIYVILSDTNKPMHFSEIADAIKDSSFKRKNVTTQAIHNELIKDPRFVLIGRGIYALSSWGFNKGTVAEIIADVLTKSPEPLHRDEIVKRVLKSRQVKETTILLNLQSKSQFKRVAKATYALNVEKQ
jgi:DNA-binding CsgD family transcriptional regulator